jgi:diketogulonate reductase-like aldo/keto reductase|eukprot:COSAG06_NODE_3856_length_4827_cov_10.381557_1_plen_58_part_00
MEDAYLNEMKGKIRALGVSNFDSNMLELLSKTSRVRPAVNQARDKTNRATSLTVLSE